MMKGYTSLNPNARKSEEVVHKMVEIFWTQQPLADAFLEGRKTWLKPLSETLFVSAKDLEAAVDAYGKEAMRKMVMANPAGEIPMVPVQRHTMSMCEYSSYRCGDQTACSACGTGQSCGTCYCGAPKNGL